MIKILLTLTGGIFAILFFFLPFIFPELKELNYSIWGIIKIASMEELIKIISFFIGGIYSVLYFGIAEFFIYLFTTKEITLLFLIFRCFIILFHLGLTFLFIKPVKKSIKILGFILAIIVHSTYNLIINSFVDINALFGFIILITFSIFGFINFQDFIENKKK